MKSKFKIKGLDCVNCAINLEKAIQKLDSVERVTINFLTQKMEIEYDDTKSKEIKQKIKKLIKKEEPDVTIEEI